VLLAVASRLVLGETWPDPASATAAAPANADIQPVTAHSSPIWTDDGDDVRQRWAAHIGGFARVARRRLEHAR
jgi:hypothetical protein